MSVGAHLEGVDLRRRCSCNCGCRAVLSGDDLLLCKRCCEEPDAKRLAKLYHARVAARALEAEAMNTGRRIDRRDAEYLRLIEALAREFDRVEITYNAQFPEQPWAVILGTPYVCGFRFHASLNEALDAARAATGREAP